MSWRRHWPLAALALLFFGPLLVAVLLYAGRGAIGDFAQIPNPDRELIADPPTLPLAPLALADGTATEPDWARSRWSLIYARAQVCEARCEAALIRLHQVYLALGADRERVQQFLLAPARAAGIVVPDGFVVATLAPPGGTELMRILGTERLEKGRYFVVDPLGNMILSYPDDADRERLLKDLERLLEVSRVG